MNVKHDSDEPYKFIDANDFDIFRSKEDMIDDDKLSIGGFGFGFFHINNEFNEFKIIK